MDGYMSGIIIAGVCILVLLMGAFRRKKEWIINFILRAVMGTVFMFFINGFLVSRGICIDVGINPLTVLTSGFLGIPGLIMLYGINLYTFL